MTVKELIVKLSPYADMKVAVQYDYSRYFEPEIIFLDTMPCDDNDAMPGELEDTYYEGEQREKLGIVETLIIKAKTE